MSDNHKPLETDAILSGRYKILGILGGTHSIVYQAQPLNRPYMPHQVAIKERYLSSDSDMRALRLKACDKEKTLLSTLSHTSIPQLFDFFDQDDCAYIVMERINGLDIKTLQDNAKELPVAAIVRWAIELCNVLDYLHKQPTPIVFRGMCPANIMLEVTGRVKLVGFGRAVAFTDTNRKYPLSEIKGYSAPEEYVEELSPLTDVYSLAATLHHVITKTDPHLEPPFSFSSRPLRDFNPQAPEPLEDIVSKALEFNSEDRYQSAAEMKAALEKLR